MSPSVASQNRVTSETALPRATDTILAKLSGDVPLRGNSPTKDDVEIVQNKQQGTRDLEFPEEPAGGDRAHWPVIVSRLLARSGSPVFSCRAGTSPMATPDSERYSSSRIASLF